MQIVRSVAVQRQGDLGTSFWKKTPVAELLVSRLPNTLKIVGVAAVAAMVFGIMIGLASAAVSKKRNSGTVFSTLLAVLKMGMAISGAIVGWTLGLSGYVAQAPHQQPAAMMAIVALFSVVPGLLSLLSALAMRGYKLNDATMRTINQNKVSAQPAATASPLLQPQELS